MELPETYVLSKQINQTLTGKRIMNVTAGAFPHKFAWYSCDPAKYNDMLSRKIITGSNPGTGYTCGGNTEIMCEDMLLVMSTPIRYHTADEKLPAKHQLLIELEDSSHISCTVQMWGAMLCFRSDDEAELESYKAKKCPTPLEEGFDESYFEALLSKAEKGLSAKAFLATEQRIPGLGNGVLQDILWNAKINPRTKLNMLDDIKLTDMYKSVKSTLISMAENGGRDTEKDLFGCPGGYKTVLSGKTVDSPCPECGNNIIREAYMGGNVYYCPQCQRYEK